MYERTINLMRTINFKDRLFTRNFKRTGLLEIARQITDVGTGSEAGLTGRKQDADHASRASDSDSENSASCSGPKAALSASAPPSSRPFG